MLRIRLAALALALLTPSVALADRAPSSPGGDPPPPPAPEKVATPTPEKAATPAPEKAATPAPDAKKAEKQEAGGMCRVGAPGAGWELLVLLGLGLRGRRKLS